MAAARTKTAGGALAGAASEGVYMWLTEEGVPSGSASRAAPKRIRISTEQ